MKLGELAWQEYQKKVSRKILGLARRIIERETEGLEKFLESSEFEALSENSQAKLRKEAEDSHKIVAVLMDSFSLVESSPLELSELGPESESRIKQAVSEAAKRLRPMDQKGMLGALQPKETEKESQSGEESIRSAIFSKKGEEKIEDISERKINELLHSGKMPETQCKILEILSLLHYEIQKIRISAEAIPKELREIRVLFARIESKRGFE